MTESGAQLFARLEARRCLKDIEPRLFPAHGGPEHGDVVELHGPEGTGKTELLYHLLCRCVMPTAAGGLEVEVIFVDTDYSLDMLRLVSILDRRLSEAHSSGAASAAAPELALRSCLSRLLVVHCSSSSQLVLTLHLLETSFLSRPGLALLLIDSISAFYWLDRSEGGGSTTKQEEKLSKCSLLLARLLRWSWCSSLTEDLEASGCVGGLHYQMVPMDYRITVFATCHAIRRNFAGLPASSDSARPHLCRSWQRLVKHRLLCSREETVDSMSDSVKGDKGERRRQVFGVQYTSPSLPSHRSSSFYVSDGGVQFV
ncbi:DNA repair protein XRCC2 X-ray repair cross-complementing protein 2 [Takifugu flavidus]|uniref:DNA repair protein XRCC2 X-ray repair cross-complementing protein 2 n=1 Tax=Takifugu flavidus TaxID=433684 RepID=A0A5C6NSV6_9TELE|nr:DNA repair protein XRCC2 X-ray repair cross-complementing protein 2 [Takifugu flavidus]